MGTVVVFNIGESRLAIQVGLVQRIVWSVEITALPNQARSAGVEGVINVEGTIVPVYDFRLLLTGQTRELSLDDQFMILDCGTGCIALIVDSVDGVLHYEDEQFSELDNADLSYATGVIKLDTELLLVVDPESIVAAKSNMLGANMVASSGARA